LLVVVAVLWQAKLSMEDSLQPVEVSAVVAPPVVALPPTLPEKDMQQIAQAVAGILLPASHCQDCQLHQLPQPSKFCML